MNHKPSKSEPSVDCCLVMTLDTALRIWWLLAWRMRQWSLELSSLVWTCAAHAEI